MSDHRKNIVNKLGLPEWVANAVHEISPTKESFLLAKYVRDEAVRRGFCDKTNESVKKGFYSDSSFKFKMSYRKDLFCPPDFEDVKEDLVNIKDNLHIKQNIKNIYK